MAANALLEPDLRTVQQPLDAPMPRAQPYTYFGVKRRDNARLRIQEIGIDHTPGSAKLTVAFAYKSPQGASIFWRGHPGGSGTQVEARNLEDQHWSNKMRTKIPKRKSSELEARALRLLGDSRGNFQQAPEIKECLSSAVRASGMGMEDMDVVTVFWTGRFWKLAAPLSLPMIGSDRSRRVRCQGRGRQHQFARATDAKKPAPESDKGYMGERCISTRIISSSSPLPADAWRGGMLLGQDEYDTSAMRGTSAGILGTKTPPLDTIIMRFGSPRSRAPLPHTQIRRRTQMDGWSVGAGYRGRACTKTDCALDKILLARVLLTSRPAVVAFQVAYLHRRGRECTDDSRRRAWQGIGTELVVTDTDACRTALKKEGKGLVGRVHRDGCVVECGWCKRGRTRPLLITKSTCTSITCARSRAPICVRGWRGFRAHAATGCVGASRRKPSLGDGAASFGDTAVEVAVGGSMWHTESGRAA
ncbi:hypothetical protein K438DRAFT_1758758 [Mycena galopus ATCC 62051]|nr:hypothetical protein K438DRAFT_1758758 [Mycena galopus ATCC 62051]